MSPAFTEAASGTFPALIAWCLACSVSACAVSKCASASLRSASATLIICCRYCDLRSEAWTRSWDAATSWSISASLSLLAYCFLRRSRSASARLSWASATPRSLFATSRRARASASRARALASASWARPSSTRAESTGSIWASLSRARPESSTLATGFCEEQATASKAPPTDIRILRMENPRCANHNVVPARRRSMGYAAALHGNRRCCRRPRAAHRRPRGGTPGARPPDGHAGGDLLARIRAPHRRVPPRRNRLPAERVAARWLLQDRRLHARRSRRARRVGPRLVHEQGRLATLPGHRRRARRELPPRLRADRGALRVAGLSRPLHHADRRHSRRAGGGGPADRRPGDRGGRRPGAVLR